MIFQYCLTIVRSDLNVAFTNLKSEAAVIPYPFRYSSIAEIEVDFEKKLAAKVEAARISDELRIDYTLVRTSRKLSINVPSRINISEPLVSCYGSFESERAHFLLSSKHAQEFIRKKSEEDNFLKYLGDFMPRTGRNIGLVTFQNGIMNTPEDFELMGKQIMANFPENPLCIGLYNEKLGLLNHLRRVPLHLRSKMTKVVGKTYVFLKTLIKRIHSINPNLIWIHVMHSEGGAIGNRALGAMSPDRIALFQKNLITVAYGPLLPIPRDYALRTYNAYSSQDRTTGVFGMYYKYQPEYDITVESVSPARWKKALELTSIAGAGIANLPPGDHDFRGATYQSLLTRDIENIRDEMRKRKL